MKKIVVPTDFSANSRHALNYASNISKINGSKLYLLHVTLMPTFYINDFSNYSIYEKELHNSINNIKKMSRENLDNFIDDILPDIETHSGEIALGYSVYKEIVDYATKVKADIIIMGSHSRGKKSLFGLGSNTERVIRSTKIPVLITCGSALPRKIKKIVFASDFGKDARNIYPFVNKFIKPFNPDIHLLYINTKAEFQEFEDIKKKMLRFEKLFGGNFHMIVRASNTVDEGINNYANSIKADLIAIGLRRRKGIFLYLSDRITEGVIRNSKVPVLAVDNPAT